MIKVANYKYVTWGLIFLEGTTQEILCGVSSRQTRKDNTFTTPVPSSSLGEMDASGLGGLRHVPLHTYLYAHGTTCAINLSVTHGSVVLSMCLDFFCVCVASE